MVDDFVIRLLAVGTFPVLDEEPERSEYLASLVISSPGHDDRTNLKGEWRLQSLEIEGETLTILPGTELTMAIDLADDGKGFASGSGGCNGFTASAGLGENAAFRPIRRGHRH